MSIERRLKVLEQKASGANAEWEVPIEVRVLFRAIEPAAWSASFGKVGGGNPKSSRISWTPRRKVPGVE